MALKSVRVLLGQSNMEGLAPKVDLPAALRGPQANSYIYNYDNNAIEVLDVDGVGLNLPNATTGHLANYCGPEMQLQAEIVAAEGESYIFKYAIGGTALGPSSGQEWNVEAAELFAQFQTRWASFVADMDLLGHTVVVPEVYWMQGEADITIEGNDEAYYGLFKRFISGVRTVLAEYKPEGSEIKWITGLVHTTITAAGYQYLYPRVQNVRSAQLRAGWSDPYYRVVDTDNFSRQLDQVHLDTDGVVAFGTALWNAAQLDYNNSMPLEDYTLGSLRQRLAEEYGIDTSIASNASIIDKRINDAISWIVNRRKNWPWQEKNAEIFVGDTSSRVSATRYGSAIFTLGSVSAQYAIWSGGNIIYPRELIDFNGQGDSGIMVTSYAGTTITLKHRYKGEQQICTITDITFGNPTIFTVSLNTTQGGTAEIPTNVSTFKVIIDNTVYAGGSGGTYDGVYTATRVSANQFSIPVNSTTHSPWSSLGGDPTAQIAREFVVAQGYFELPEDYIRNSSAHQDDVVDTNTLYYRDPTTFQREVHAEQLPTDLDRIYTVVPDPINVSSKKYMGVYPYYTDRHLIYFNYFADAKKLVGDNDVPDIPRSDRYVVFCAAAWFVAQWQKDVELLTFYRDTAMNELERMAKEYQLSDDVTQDIEQTYNEFGPVRGPNSFPEFDL